MRAAPAGRRLLAKRSPLRTFIMGRVVARRRLVIVLAMTVRIGLRWHGVVIKMACISMLVRVCLPGVRALVTPPLTSWTRIATTMSLTFGRCWSPGVNWDIELGIHLTPLCLVRPLFGFMVVIHITWAGSWLGGTGLLRRLATWRTVCEN